MVTIGIDVVLFLVIGLFAGAHCIGMCGPLVTVYGDRMTSTGEHVEHPPGRVASGHLTLYEVRQHALFNLGRATSYAVVGSVLGGVGGLVFLTVGRVAVAADVVRGVVGIGFGVAIVVIGGYYLVGRSGVGLYVPGSGRVSAFIHRVIDDWVNGPGIFGLGAIHALLPCPILYPAYLFAFATGSALAGGVALLALGLGTMPAVFLFGTLMGELNVTNRRRLHRVLGLAFVVLGYVLLAHGLMSIGVDLPHPELPFWGPLGDNGAHPH